MRTLVSWSMVVLMGSRAPSMELSTEMSMSTMLVEMAKCVLGPVSPLLAAAFCFLVGWW